MKMTPELIVFGIGLLSFGAGLGFVSPALALIGVGALLMYITLGGGRAK